MNNKDESIIYERGNKKKNKVNVGVLIFFVFFIFIFILPFGFIFFSFKTVENFSEKIHDEIFDYTDDYTKFNDESYSIDNVKGYYNSELKIYYVEGYLKNITNKDFDDISISYSVYDNNNILLGEASSFVSGLKAGNTWKFKATYLDVDSNEVKKYDLLRVDIY